MPNVVNTLYAPLISTFMRAFPNTSDAVVYFSYSPLNDDSKVKKVHVSLVNQLNNENALEDPTGILIYDATVPEDEESIIQNTVGLDTKTGLHYIILPRNILKNSTEWNINQFYKVQLRLDSTEGGSYSNYRDKMDYLTTNQEHFSEWSTVCLLRPILQPNIYIKPWALHDKGDYTANFNKGVVHLDGFVQFGGEDSAETETLQSYVVEIYPEIISQDTQPLWSSGNIYTGNSIDPNDINYRFTLQDLDTSQSSRFILRVTITTKNQYITYEDFPFGISDYVEMTDFHPLGVHEDPNDQDLYVDLDEEEGVATFRFRNLVAIYGIIHVKRSSNLSNYLEWETIYEARVNDVVDITIRDNTIGAFVWYRYSIQLENSVGAMSNVYYTAPFLSKFYDAFISRLDKQLDVRYDLKITSVKPVVNRTKIDTLGGKYPKFAENAILNYKQFSVTGVISAEGDYNQLFLNKQDYYGEEYQNYRVYLSQEEVESVVRNDSKHYLDPASDFLTTTRNDYFWEREFREEVIKWLNDGEPKLFRSVTEGNVPVMITDISLTPKAQINRLLYDFSATMYEVGEGHSIADLEALGIYHVPRVEEQMGDGNPGSGAGEGGIDDYRTVQMVSQVYRFSPTDNNNLITSGIIKDTLLDRYKMGGIYAQREAYNLYITNVKIFFHNKPHIFLVSADGGLRQITDPTPEQAASGRLRMGYTFQLQNSNSAAWETIFVNERGYYQIPNNLNITGLAFNQYTDISGNIGDTVTIEYIAVFNERSAAGSLISSSSVERSVIGQYEGVFKPNVYLGDMIRSKYSYSTPLYAQHMKWWKGICLDVNPYAVAYIRYRNETKYNKYVVGRTGVLHLLKDIPIDNIYFAGLFMVEQDFQRQDYLQPWEYVIDDDNYFAEVDEVKKPKNNTVYHIAEGDMIYYQDTWKPFEDAGDGTGIAAVNTSGQINFVGDVIREEF